MLEGLELRGHKACTRYRPRRGVTAKPLPWDKTAGRLRAFNAPRTAIRRARVCVSTFGYTSLTGTCACGMQSRNKELHTLIFRYLKGSHHPGTSLTSSGNYARGRQQWAAKTLLPLNAIPPACRDVRIFQDVPRTTTEASDDQETSAPLYPAFSMKHYTASTPLPMTCS